jgi:hypothetical protein
MIKKLLGAAAMAAVAAYTVVPASAAKMAGCSGENMMKTESMIDAMADGEGKITAQKEIALAQTAMLDGKMGACGMHLSKAMHTGHVEVSLSQRRLAAGADCVAIGPLSDARNCQGAWAS